MKQSHTLPAFLQQVNRVCNPAFIRRFLLFLLISEVCFSGKAQNIIYVNYAAAGANNGSSWANAFKSLQNAVDAAQPGDKIWVAKGVYKPVLTFGGTTDRYKTFYFNKNIELYGGFTGTEDSLSQRDFEENITILSGDVDNNDINNDGDFIADSTADIVGDNVFHVVRIDTVSDMMRLDGFTITAGKASGGNFSVWQGGGIYNVCEEAGKQSNPMIANCIFSGNYASSGGAVFNRAVNGGVTSPIFANCAFYNNYGFVSSGAVQNFSDNSTASPTFNNCVFSGNKANSAGGGAVENAAQNNGTANPVLANCIFTNNSARTGGSIYNSGSDPVIVNCIFAGNYASLGGGAMYNTTFGSPVVTNCVFTYNTALQDGGAMSNINGNTVITNCSFFGNSTNSFGQTMHNFSGTQTIVNCIIWGNTTSGISNSVAGGAEPQISYTLLKGTICPPGAICGSGMIFDQDPLFADAANGNLHLQSGSPAIDAGDNSAVLPGDSTDVIGNPRIFNATNLPVAQVDLGAYEFDMLISASPPIGGGNQEELIIFPNPAVSTANLSLHSNAAERATLYVFSSSGRLVLARRIPLAGGENVFPLSVETLPPDVYVVQINRLNKQNITGFLIKSID